MMTAGDVSSMNVWGKEDGKKRLNGDYDSLICHTFISVEILPSLPVYSITMNVQYVLMAI
jgi:hypothetical protein